MQNYYHDLNCPLDIFEKIHLGECYELLLIDGDYDNEKAGLAWMSIYDTYQDSIKSNKNNTAFIKKNQMDSLIDKYSIIKGCLFLITQKLEFNLINESTKLDKNYTPLTYVDEVAILNKFRFKVDINNIDKEIIRVNKQKENIKTQINILKKELDPIAYEYEEKIKKAGDNEKLITKLLDEYKAKKEKENNTFGISETIQEARMFQGFPFWKDATVRDLVICLNKMIVHNNAIKQNKKHGK